MGLLAKIFKKSGPVVLDKCDLSVLGTDVHSHLIPGIDDGVKTLQESIEVIKAFANRGYKKLVTTPHIMSDFYRNTPEIILGGLEQVRKEIKAQGIPIELDAAAEYNIDHEFEAKIDAGKLLTFGGNYILVEMPFMQEPPNLAVCIFKLMTAGLKPVLAHVERYTFWHNDYQKIIEQKDKGVLLQLNINSLTGAYGPGVSKMAKRLIEDDLIDLVGSDCHKIEHMHFIDQARTTPQLHNLIEKKDLLNKML